MKLACSLLSVLVLASGCTSFSHKSQRTVSETLETSPLEKLVLKTFNGSVTIETHDSPTVEMETTFSAYGSSEDEARENCEKLGTELEAEDGVLRLTATKPNNQWSASASYKLFVPRDCNVELNSSNGTITVTNLIASVRVKTSNGSVEIKEVLGDVSVNTSNGRVVVRDVTGTVDVETSNGQIEYNGRPVGDGNSLRSSNGRVTANVDLASVVLVSASTSNGGISCVAEKYQEQPGGSKKRKQILIGEGDAEAAKLQIRTSNGSIGLGDYNALEIQEPQHPSEQPTPSSEAEASDFEKEEIS